MATTKLITINATMSVDSFDSNVKSWLDSASLGKYYQDFIDANISDEQVSPIFMLRFFLTVEKKKKKKKKTKFKKKKKVP
jgi:hypothetical protein